MKKLKSIIVQKQWSTFDKFDTIHNFYLESTSKLLIYRTYDKFLKYYTPLFYRYCFWLLRLFKLKTSLLVFRKYLQMYPKFYVLFPFHKIVRQMYFKDNEFYSFFCKNPKFKGVFLPHYIFSKTIRLSYKKTLLNFSKSFFGGLNYLVVDTTLTPTQNLVISNKVFESSLNWNKTNISLKSVVSVVDDMRLLFFNLFYLDVFFYMYLNFIKEIYSFFILFLLLKL